MLWQPPPPDVFEMEFPDLPAQQRRAAFLATGDLPFHVKPQTVAGKLRALGAELARAVPETHSAASGARTVPGTAPHLAANQIHRAAALQTACRAKTLPQAGHSGADRRHRAGRGNLKGSCCVGVGPEQGPLQPIGMA